VPPRKKVQAQKSLEATLWDAADELRGKMDSAVYKHVVLGLIFLKYVSDTFMVRHAQLQRLVDDESTEYFMPSEATKQSVLEDRDEYIAEGVFWIPDGHRWEDLRKAAKRPDIGKRVDAAMEAIERDNPSLKGVLPKNYTQRELSSESIGGLIDAFSRQDLAAEEYKDLDVLGRVYEYFLGQFASNSLRCCSPTMAASSIQRAARVACSSKPTSSLLPMAAAATTYPSSVRNPTRRRGG